MNAPQSKENARPRRMLVAYSAASTFTATTIEYLEALRRYSGFEVDYVHVTHNARMDFDINQYDVVFHSYCARLVFDGYVSRHWEAELQRFLGLKMIAVQDEYDNTAALHRAIRRLGFHVFFTCVPPKCWPLAHPQSELPGVRLVQVLTGYVPEHLSSLQHVIKPLTERTRKVAYRGRDIGARYGLLGFDKFEIGRRMAEVCAAKGIPHDIAMDEASRIYGDAWYAFIADSRTMLGSESGANAFDFEGELTRRIAAENSRLGRKAGYADVKEILEPFEAPFDIGQISPRVFECAALMTPMILYRGSYSGAIEPDVHYIALERDFSNIVSILARIDDLPWLQGFAERAHAQLVASQRYSYKAFVGIIDETAREEYARRIDPDYVAFRRATSSEAGRSDRNATAAGAASNRPHYRSQRPTQSPLDQTAFQKVAMNPWVRTAQTIYAKLPDPVRSGMKSVVPLSVRRRLM